MNRLVHRFDAGACTLTTTAELVDGREFVSTVTWATLEEAEQKLPAAKKAAEDAARRSEMIEMTRGNAKRVHTPWGDIGIAVLRGLPLRWLPDPQAGRSRSGRWMIGIAWGTGAVSVTSLNPTNNDGAS